MRKFNSPLLLMLAIALLTGQAAIAQNLIPNPGFEQGTGDNFTNWNVYNEISGTFSAGVAEDEFRSGSRALKGEVTMPGEPWQLQLASDPIPTQVGEEYRFSIWVKADTAGTEIRFSTQPSALYSANYSVSTDWTELTWTFTANEDMTRLVLDIGAEVNTYFLDDMSLSGPSGEPGSCQLIENGGFESYNTVDSAFSAWEVYNENGGSSFALASGAEAYQGNQALQANNAGGIPRWGLQIGTPAFATEPGQTYTLSLWIKAETGGANAIQFSTRDGNGANEGQYTNSAGTIDGDWTQISYTFDAIDEATVITLNLGDETANTYYIDEVCVVYPDPTDNCLPVDNGSFESYDDGSSTFASWTYYNQGNGSSFSATTEAADVYEGDRALVANNTAGTQTFQLQVASPSFYTYAGGTYRFKIWIKAATADVNTIQFSVRDAADPQNTEQQYTTSASTIGSDWMQVSYEFTAPSARSLVTLNLGGDTANTFYIDAVCVKVQCGTAFSAPADQEPIAAGKEKFLGNVYAPHALPGFEKYFNQVTPENSAKWGSVETQRDSFDWTALDEARQFALDNNFPFRFHVMVWGSQQPGWLASLPQAEQVTELREWFEAVSTRYSGEAAPEYVEIVNEPLNAPPVYQDALSSLNQELGTEPGEFDWIVNAFKLGRQYFPATTQLMINEYGTENTTELNNRYVAIIQTLQADGLIDAIGIQGHTFSTRKYGGSYEALNNLLESNLDALAQLGLPIIVTEMDIEGDMYFDTAGEPQDGGTQAQRDSFQLAEYQRIFDLYWYHPSVVGITLWGWQPGLWQDDAEAYLIDPCTGQERPALHYLNGPIRDSDPMINLVTDVESRVPTNSSLRLYPTLVGSELNLEGLTQPNGQIWIFELSGRLRQSIPYQTFGERLTINVAGLPPGLYLLQAGAQVQKFVKR